MLTRKLMILAIAAPFFAVTPTLMSPVSYANAEVIEGTSAIALVKRLGSEAVTLLSDKNITDSVKRAGFKEIVVRDFNMPLIGRFVLGKHWRKSSKQQQAEFQELFQQYIISTYQKRIGDYAGENLKIVKSRPLNEKEVLVKTQILRPKGPPIKLDWRVRKSKQGALKIVDIIVENVSMALTHRAEFSSVVSNNNGSIERLLEKLRAHAAKNAK